MSPQSRSPDTVPLPSPGVSKTALKAMGNAIPGQKTSLMERILILISFMLLPLENQLPTVAGLSISFLIFGVLGVHILVNRPQALRKVWLHPVFLAAYVLIFVTVMLETLHSDSDYSTIIRLALMFAGAILIAAMSRDRSALRAGMYGCLLAGLGLSILLFLTHYGILSRGSASDFQEASLLRAEAAEADPLQANLNTMAFFAAQGTVVALVIALTSVSKLTRVLFSVVCVFCMVATFLPVSRSGVIVVIVSCVIVLLTYRGQGKISRALLMVGALGAAVIFLVPSAVFSRFSFSTDVVDGKQEGRARVYTSAIKNFAEYAPLGVGAGTYWKHWAVEHGFFHTSRHGVGALGAHNCFFQLTINWGVPGLLAALLVIGQAYRCVRAVPAEDRLAPYLRGLSVTLILQMFAMHNYYAKEFTLGLGQIVGMHRWLFIEKRLPSRNDEGDPPRIA